MAAEMPDILSYDFSMRRLQAAMVSRGLSSSVRSCHQCAFCLQGGGLIRAAPASKAASQPSPPVLYKNSGCPSHAVSVLLHSRSEELLLQKSQITDSALP